MIVKVCGFEDSADALFAVECGATSIGVNFYPGSPRFVSDRRAETMCRDLEGLATRVGVFVGWPERIYPFLDILQIHGLKPGEPIPDLNAEQEAWIACGPDQAPNFCPQMVVIDTSWGEGVKGDWSRVATLQQPFILSGGLDAHNVREAICRFRPAGVDVCSGVESSAGQKDRGKIQAFLESVSSACAEIATKRV